MGLERYRLERPDVVVLDLNMPEPDGVTALKEIRSVDLNQSVNHVDGRQHPDNRAAHP